MVFFKFSYQKIKKKLSKSKNKKLTQYLKIENNNYVIFLILIIKKKINISKSKNK